MPPAAHLIKLAFASGTAELNRGMLDHFASTPPDLPLVVVAEFAPHRGEWIPYHVPRSVKENTAAIRAAVAGRFDHGLLPEALLTPLTARGGPLHSLQL